MFLNIYFFLSGMRELYLNNLCKIPHLGGGGSALVRLTYPVVGSVLINSIFNNKNNKNIIPTLNGVLVSGTI